MPEYYCGKVVDPTFTDFSLTGTFVDACNSNSSAFGGGGTIYSSYSDLESCLEDYLKSNNKHPFTFCNNKIPSTNYLSILELPTEEDECTNIALNGFSIMGNHTAITTPLTDCTGEAIPYKKDQLTNNGYLDTTQIMKTWCNGIMDNNTNQLCTYNGTGEFCQIDTSKDINKMLQRSAIYRCSKIGDTSCCKEVPSNGVSLDTCLLGCKNAKQKCSNIPTPAPPTPSPLKCKSYFGLVDRYIDKWRLPMNDSIRNDYINALRKSNHTVTECDPPDNPSATNCKTY